MYIISTEIMIEEMYKNCIWPYPFCIWWSWLDRQSESKYLQRRESLTNCWKQIFSKSVVNEYNNYGSSNSFFSLKPIKKFMPNFQTHIKSNWLAHKNVSNLYGISRALCACGPMKLGPSFPCIRMELHLLS